MPRNSITSTLSTPPSGRVSGICKSVGMSQSCQNTTRTSPRDCIGSVSAPIDPSHLFGWSCRLTVTYLDACPTGHTLNPFAGHEACRGDVAQTIVVTVVHVLPTRVVTALQFGRHGGVATAASAYGSRQNEERGEISVGEVTMMPDERSKEVELPIGRGPAMSRRRQH